MSGFSQPPKGALHSETPLHVVFWENDCILGKSPLAVTFIPQCYLLPTRGHCITASAKIYLACIASFKVLKHGERKINGEGGGLVEDVISIFFWVEIKMLLGCCRFVKSTMMKYVNPSERIFVLECCKLLI